MSQSYWAVITALIIVQGSVGGTLAAGLDRFVGTLAGAVLGAAAALAGEFWRVPQVLLLLLAVAPVALLAAIRPSFRIAPVTAAIVPFTTEATPLRSPRRWTASLPAIREPRRRAVPLACRGRLIPPKACLARCSRLFIHQQRAAPLAATRRRRSPVTYLFRDEDITDAPRVPLATFIRSSQLSP
jgi:Fusaric acid resistance protein-like